MPNQNYNTYVADVKNYIESGKLPDNITKEEFVNKIGKLNNQEKEWLRSSIRYELPMDDWAYLAPQLENIPKAAGWAVATGIGGSLADYQYTKNIYSAAKTGFCTGALTFFGQQLYKRQQVNNMWHTKEQRANEFLQHLPQMTLSKFN